MRPPCLSGVGRLCLVVIFGGLATACDLGITAPSYGTPPGWNPALNTHPDGPALQELLDRYVRQGIPGSVLYVRTPAGLWNGASGYARIESAERMLPTHVHHAASVTKMYTAAAVMLLAEDGVIDLDVQASEYLPAWAYDGVPNAASSTVQQLLGHTSGIPDFGDSQAYEFDTLNDPLGSYTPARLLSYLKGLTPLFTPGNGYFYSNADYVLLALLIEQVSGASHAAFISERIFQPLGLSQTWYRNEPGFPTPTGLVNSYQDLLGDGRLVNVSDLAVHAAEAGYGQAGLMASAADFAAFLDGLLRGFLVGPASLDAMHERARCDCYGLGLSFLDTQHGLAVGHDGGDVGTRTQVRHFPASDATIVLLTNGGDGGVPDDLFDRLWDEALDLALGSAGIQSNAQMLPAWIGSPKSSGSRK